MFIGPWENVATADGGHGEIKRRRLTHGWIVTTAHNGHITSCFVPNDPRGGEWGEVEKKPEPEVLTEGE